MKKNTINHPRILNVHVHRIKRCIRAKVYLNEVLVGSVDVVPLQAGARLLVAVDHVMRLEGSREAHTLTTPLLTATAAPA